MNHGDCCNIRGHVELCDACIERLQHKCGCRRWLTIRIPTPTISLNERHSRSNSHSYRHKRSYRPRHSQRSEHHESRDLYGADKRIGEIDLSRSSFSSYDNSNHSLEDTGKDQSNIRFPRDSSPDYCWVNKMNTRNGIVDSKPVTPNIFLKMEPIKCKPRIIIHTPDLMQLSSAALSLMSTGDVRKANRLRTPSSQARMVRSKHLSDVNNFDVIHRRIPTPSRGAVKWFSNADGVELTKEARGIRKSADLHIPRRFLMPPNMRMSDTGQVISLPPIDLRHHKHRSCCTHF